MEPTVFLFDVDGVLVKPGGYRAAVRATVNYFTRQLNLGDLSPSDETVAIVITSYSIHYTKLYEAEIRAARTSVSNR